MPTVPDDLKDRQLRLFTEIDKIRDAFHDRTDDMLDRLLEKLVQQFSAEGGALVTIEASAIEHIAVIQMTATAAKKMCMALIETNTPPPSTPEMNRISTRIALDDEVLGALVLQRTTPFTDDDTAVLATAETLLDSSIMQARRTKKLMQRDKELAAIYEVDRLRDQHENETELVTGFTQTVVDQLEAQMAIVLLNDIDSGESVIRGMIDKLNHTPDDLVQIRERVSKLQQPEMLMQKTSKHDLNLLISPFTVSDMQLGAVVVGREPPFQDADRRLLHALTSQMDSAVVYSRVIQQLASRNKELEIIYQIDQIRDSDIDFDAMLQGILGEMCRAVSAEVGYILLYNEKKEDQLEIKSSTETGVFTSTDYYQSIHQASRIALDAGEMHYDNDVNTKDVRSVISVPLVLRERVIGVFGAVNSVNKRGFNAEDRRMLYAITSQIDTAVFERMEQRRLRKVLGRSVDPKVLEYLMHNSRAADVLEGERMNISVLFADLRGSTEWAERSDPHELAKTLNAYLGRMTEVIFKHAGTLDKFVGDEVIGLFGAPLKQDDHAVRAIRAGVEMQRTIKELQSELAAEGKDLPPMGVGISSGEAICGEFGTEIRTDFTAMGRMMNLGSRLCSAAAGDEVVISEATYHSVISEVDAEPMGSIVLKGIGAVQAYRVKTYKGVL